MTFYQPFFAVALINFLNRLLRKIEREVLGWAIVEAVYLVQSHKKSIASLLSSDICI